MANPDSGWVGSAAIKKVGQAFLGLLLRFCGAGQGMSPPHWMQRSYRCFVNVMIRSGGPVSREEVLARLRERIVLFAASRLSRDVAEDLAQEVLMLLHEKYAHLEQPEDLLPLSLQIVRFKIMSLRRKAVRRGEYTQVSITDLPLPDLDANPADAFERKEMLERLTRAMAQLGDRCREILRLKLQGKSFPEIQKIL